jgi:hypothetical protein
VKVIVPSLSKRKGWDRSAIYAKVLGLVSNI